MKDGATSAVQKQKGFDEKSVERKRRHSVSVYVAAVVRPAKAHSGDLIAPTALVWIGTHPTLGLGLTVLSGEMYIWVSECAIWRNVWLESGWR